MLGNQLPCHPFGSVLHRRAPAPVEAALPHTALRQGAVLWVPITSPGPIQQLDFHRVEASDEGGAIGGGLHVHPRLTPGSTLRVTQVCRRSLGVQTPRLRAHWFPRPKRSEDDDQGRRLYGKRPGAGFCAIGCA